MIPATYTSHPYMHVHFFHVLASSSLFTLSQPHTLTRSHIILQPNTFTCMLSCTLMYLPARSLSHSHAHLRPLMSSHTYPHHTLTPSTISHLHLHTLTSSHSQDGPQVRVNQDTRLDNRIIDLRVSWGRMVQEMEDIRKEGGRGGWREGRREGGRV